MIMKRRQYSSKDTRSEHKALAQYPANSSVSRKLDISILEVCFTGWLLWTRIDGKDGSSLPVCLPRVPSTFCEPDVVWPARTLPQTAHSSPMPSTVRL